MRRPRLALVPGEPAGVGPELAVAALRRESSADLVVFAAEATLARAARALGTSLTFHDARAGAERLASDGVRLVEVPNSVEPAFGVPDPRNARSVVLALRMAAEACMAGEYDGIVTGPVHKAAVNAGGIAYTGTTELLAAHAGCAVVMMLANDAMRVALATTHLPLRQVAAALDGARLERTLRILHAALRDDFGIAEPVIAVLGLNPHAGEEGHLGSEEIEVIAPVLERLRAEGMRLDGPLPADTAFLPRRLARTDAVLAMYHDQGLPVLKYSGFEQAVNLTLGLPYPRVAVDHGTALDLAGSGRADPSSMLAAVDACARIAVLRHARKGRP